MASVRGFSPPLTIFGSKWGVMLSLSVQTDSSRVTKQELTHTDVLNILALRWQVGQKNQAENVTTSEVKIASVGEKMLLWFCLVHAACSQFLTTIFQ